MKGDHLISLILFSCSGLLLLWSQLEIRMQKKILGERAFLDCIIVTMNVARGSSRISNLEIMKWGLLAVGFFFYLISIWKEIIPTYGYHLRLYS
jgi:hypothetical protein